jgi:L-ribulose-5-phosphate 3-epimerase UlaE
MSATKPFFVPQKEINLIDSMNEELIDEVLGQYVDIYKISLDETEANVYGESATKYYNVGFRVNCMINYNEPETLQDEFGADVNSSIEMFFQRNNLASGSLNFYPEVGDITDWNNHFWEINSVTEPQLIAGHQGYRHSIVASAHRSRLSNLQIEERPR